MLRARPILDVVVDLRVGSPTFQRWEAVDLDNAGGRALFLAEGLGHALFSRGTGPRTPGIDSGDGPGTPSGHGHL